MTGDPVFDWADSELPKADLIAADYWLLWRIVDPLTIRESARLLAGLNPKPSSNRIDSDRGKAAKADAYGIALIRAVQSARVESANSLAWDGSYGDTAICDYTDEGLCDATTIHVAELAHWAHCCGISHHWSIDSREHGKGMLDLSRYPPELQAAIEAFEVVRVDPSATAGRTPKIALSAWLEMNKPELSGNARERIATVANWQPSGGAPKTPGE
jgi:hypothetical protein